MEGSGSMTGEVEDVVKLGEEATGNTKSRRLGDQRKVVQPLEKALISARVNWLREVENVDCSVPRRTH